MLLQICQNLIYRMYIRPRNKNLQTIQHTLCNETIYIDFFYFFYYIYILLFVYICIQLYKGWLVGWFLDFRSHPVRADTATSQYLICNICISLYLFDQYTGANAYSLMTDDLGSFRCKQPHHQFTFFTLTTSNQWSNGE